MKARSFSHVGITVSDFNKAVRFYWDVFGCPLVGVSDTPPERVRSFFNVEGPFDAVQGRAQPSCKIGWIRVPGGAVLEIFEFQPQLPPQAIPWNKVGLTHISFNVRNLQGWYDYLVSRGVECVSKPERSPRGHSFFFAKDFDGNLIELMDLGYMYYVLNWLGPLGGWIFRRGMYKKYYESSPVSGLRSSVDRRPETVDRRP
jgi:glyoxylase I family protein